jgi:hypothetical protein
MSSTYTIRIPRDLKEKMKRSPEEEWSREIRCFLEERVRQIELMKAIAQIESRAEGRKTKSDSTSLIREDRER